MYAAHDKQIFFVDTFSRSSFTFLHKLPVQMSIKAEEEMFFFVFVFFRNPKQYYVMNKFSPFSRFRLKHVLLQLLLSLFSALRWKERESALHFIVPYCTVYALSCIHITI